MVKARWGAHHGAGDLTSPRLRPVWHRSGRLTASSYRLAVRACRRHDSWHGSSSRSASIGLGTMGAGIAEVLRPQRPARRRRRGRRRRRSSRGRGHIENSTARAVAGGKLTADEQKALLDRITYTTTWTRSPRSTWSSRRCRSSLDLKRPVFTAARQDLQARDDPGDEHLVAVGDRDRRRDGAPRQGRRAALLQPGAGHEAGRGRAQRRHRAGRRRRRRGVRAEARQGRRHDRRPRRVHRQRAAVRLPQPRRCAVRVALREPRGHRRRDEAGLRPADGPAGPARPDRTRHRRPRSSTRCTSRAATACTPRNRSSSR